MEGPCSVYLVVVGGVGGEIRLRSKHLVHHIQAAHGEQSPGEEASGGAGAQPGFMERAEAERGGAVPGHTVSAEPLSLQCRAAEKRTPAVTHHTLIRYDPSLPPITGRAPPLP